MKNINNLRSLGVIFLIVITLPLLLSAIQTQKKYRSKAGGALSQIYIDTAKTTGPIAQTWRALAQGGEEKGVRMLSNVIGQITELSPRYIRIDHIYDFYDVASRNPDGSINLNFRNLDQTVCDILRTNAKPFFSLGYMPQALSKDGSLISPPINWGEWSYIVQKTIEHYSSKNPQICNSSLDENLSQVYYEVWNEPDLETFGKWSIYGGEKDYKALYYFSAVGAQNAYEVQPFFFGGPATTKLYANWIRYFLDYVKAFNLRLDFLSWHHYSDKPDDFSVDLRNIKAWLSDPKYQAFASLPFIISEWGYDSDVNPISDTEIAGAHTVSAIRNLIEEDLEMAFVFDIKDGPVPKWGILSSKGEEKPRFKALKLLGRLGSTRLFVSGEGTWVKALASRNFQTITAVLVNYDPSNVHTELVPVTYTNLDPGRYYFVQTEVGNDGILIKKIYLSANSVVSLELTKIKI